MWFAIHVWHSAFEHETGWQPDARLTGGDVSMRGSRLARSRSRIQDVTPALPSGNLSIAELLEQKSYLRSFFVLRVTSAF